MCDDDPCPGRSTQDTDVLRTLVRHNRIQVGDLGRFSCAGVYAVVAMPGTVRTGDQVTIV
jgi:MOSC domain-containing protein